MSGLLFLSTPDFSLTKGTKGPLLSNKIRGFSLILFYSTQCQYCHELIPIFNRLPRVIQGCSFGMVNITRPECRSLIGMSRQSIAPIEYVPLIILYIDGKPMFRYEGSYTENDIRTFISDVYTNFKDRQQQFVMNKEKIHDTGKGIPAYCLGKPLCGKDDKKKCYITYDEAYSK
jgi:thioredoxin-like negative regulator of GroEL